MALQWDFKRDRCGELIIKQKCEDGTWRDFEIRLYTGNAYLIMLWEDDAAKTYTLYSFFADKEHAKRCLGLDKKSSDGNIFDKPYERWKKIRLNKAKYPHVKELVGMLVQAFDHIEIEIVTEDA